MAQSRTDASVEEAPLPGDLATAKKFGERVVHISKRWASKDRLPYVREDALKVARPSPLRQAFRGRNSGMHTSIRLSYVDGRH